MRKGGIEGIDVAFPHFVFRGKAETSPLGFALKSGLFYPPKLLLSCRGHLARALVLRLGSYLILLSNSSSMTLALQTRLPAGPCQLSRLFAAMCSSIFLQPTSTVAWFLSPNNRPISILDIRVCFRARYIQKCLAKATVLSFFDE
jgi:hypothetical protein